MGYDIYLRWEGITKEQIQKQYTGFSVIKGHYGYLRGASWDTVQNDVFRYLFKEGWTGFNSGILYPREGQLIKRISKYDWTEWDKENREYYYANRAKRAFRNFCLLCELLIKKLGENKVWILIK